MSFRPHVATVIAALALLPAGAHAQAFSNKASFVGTAGTPFYIETFETVPVSKDAAHLSFTKAGITYTGLAPARSPNVYVSSPGYFNYGAGLNPTTTSILTANGDEWIRLTFGMPVYALGFDAYYNGLGPATSTFYNGTTVLGTVSYSGAASLGFAGFLSSLAAPITSVEFKSTAGGQLNTGIDNVLVYDAAVTAAPEPASLVLLASGLAGVALVARRRRPA